MEQRSAELLRRTLFVYAFSVRTNTPWPPRHLGNCADEQDRDQECLMPWLLKKKKKQPTIYFNHLPAIQSQIHHKRCIRLEQMWRHFRAWRQKRGIVGKVLFSSKRGCVVFENRTRYDFRTIVRSWAKHPLAINQVAAASAADGAASTCCLDSLSGVSFRQGNQAFD